MFFFPSKVLHLLSFRKLCSPLQLDPSTVPQYESESAHLAGADVSLLDQVTAEYYRVYNKFIKDVLGYSQDKWKVVFRSK